MYKVKVKTPIWYKGERYEIGEKLEIDDNDRNEKIFDVIKKFDGVKQPKGKTIEKMTVSELKEIAKEKGIEGFEDMKKPELIGAINNKSENESSGEEDEEDPDEDDENSEE